MRVGVEEGLEPLVDGSIVLGFRCILLKNRSTSFIRISGTSMGIDKVNVEERGRGKN